jgi:6-phospho-3-hexuloisomerase
LFIHICAYPTRQLKTYSLKTQLPFKWVIYYEFLIFRLYNLFMQNNIQLILGEIDSVLKQIDESETKQFIKEIRSAKKIVSTGAGRVGMALRGFTMRLGHLGLSAHIVGDATVPSVGAGDLLLVASGSGETQTIVDLVTIAKKNGCRIALVTGNPSSRMGQLADTIVRLSAPSKTKSIDGFVSLQPMTTLNEQCLGLLFDAIVLSMMEQMNETHDTMWARHSNLE